MTFFKSLFVCLVVFLLSCGAQKDRGSYDDSNTSSSSGDRREDNRGNLENENRRSLELNRLKSTNKVISAELDHRFDGGFYYEGYGGSECQDSPACMAICDSQVPKRNQNRCYRSPKSLVESLEDGFFTLLNISEVDSVDIHPGLIAGMLDINVDLVVDLVEDRMSEGDLKSFLAWVAVNEGIAEVFLEEDRRSEVMKNAFKELGELQVDAKREEETGLNVGLIGNEDSFFYLSALENNSAAFQIAYKVLKSLCRSKDCKLDLICARENQTYNRSRVFGYESNLLKCRTSAEQGRRSRREAVCYIHGSATWSYLDELIEEEEIRDNDFEGEDNQITVEKCNDHCGDKDSGKCKKLR